MKELEEENELLHEKIQALEESTVSDLRCVVNFHALVNTLLDSQSYLSP